MAKDRLLLLTSADPHADHQTSIYFMPLSLLYLGGSLAPHFEVRILDAATLGLFQDNTLDGWRRTVERIEREVRAVLKDFRPFMVGINCLFSGQITQTVRLAKLVKEFDPEIKVAVGGLHPTIFSRDIIRHCDHIDFVLQGEGEENTLDLALALKGGEDLSGIDGLTWRRGAEVVDQPKTRFIQNIDSIPRPAYGLFDFQKYQMDTSGWHNPLGVELGVTMPLMTSRSCPFRCNFCCMYRAMGPGFRAHSAARVLDDMEYLYHEYRVRQFHIMDDNFTLNRRRALDICRGLARRSLKTQLVFTNGLHLGSLDQEIVEALAEAGAVWVFMPVESGSPYIRNEVMGKHSLNEQIFEVARLLKKHPQIIVTAAFIVGLPEDDEKTIAETRRMIQELEVDHRWIFFPLPFPGTRLYEQCRLENLLLHGESRWDSSDAFIDIRPRHGNVFVKPRALTVERLLDLRADLDRLVVSLMSPRFRDLSSSSLTAKAGGYELSSAPREQPAPQRP